MLRAKLKSAIMSKISIQKGDKVEDE